MNNPCCTLSYWKSWYMLTNSNVSRQSISTNGLSELIMFYRVRLAYNIFHSITWYAYSFFKWCTAYCIFLLFKFHFIHSISPHVDTALSYNMKRVIGGHDCLKTERLYHVKLYHLYPDGQSVWQCGGSLIHEKCVLTAAHCLHDSTKGQ